MKNLHVPPLPESAPSALEPDPLLEKFRQATIQGKKVVEKSGASIDSAVDPCGLDTMLFYIDTNADVGDCGVDIDFNCDP